MNETIQQKVTPPCVSAPAPRKVYVIGHKNPDTDSIVAAMAYAALRAALSCWQSCWPQRAIWTDHLRTEADIL